MPMQNPILPTKKPPQNYQIWSQGYLSCGFQQTNKPKKKKKLIESKTFNLQTKSKTSQVWKLWTVFTSSGQRYFSLGTYNHCWSFNHHEMLSCQTMRLHCYFFLFFFSVSLALAAFSPILQVVFAWLSQWRFACCRRTACAWPT